MFSETQYYNHVVTVHTVNVCAFSTSANHFIVHFGKPEVIAYCVSNIYFQTLFKILLNILGLKLSEKFLFMRIFWK